LAVPEGAFIIGGLLALWMATAAATSPTSAPATGPSTEPTSSPATQAATQPAEPTTSPDKEGWIFDLPPHETANYIVYCDRSEEMVADLAVRLEAMHHEYRRAMKKYYRSSGEKFKVFLFADREPFMAAGGHPTMPGISIESHAWPGPRLMMICRGEHLQVPDIHLLRHEVWHHFRAANMPGRFPVWLEEGMAEFLGYGIWTGDGVIYGTIRPEAFHSLMQYVQARQIVSLAELMDMTNQTWLRRAGTNVGWRGYMQSWSLVQFLMATEDKRREALADYIEDLCRRRDAASSRRALIAFDGKYQKWVRSLTPTMTHEKIYEAAVAILGSHLGRAHLRGQRFDSGEALLAAAREGELNLPPIDDEQWLPPSLMAECVWYVHQINTAYGGPEQKGMELELSYEDDLLVLHLIADHVDLELKGAIRIKDGKVAGVDVEHLKPVPRDLDAGTARRLKRQGKLVEPPPPAPEPEEDETDDEPPGLPPGL